MRRTLNLYQMLGIGAAYCAQGNACVKAHQASFVPDCQSEKVEIGQLPWTVHVGVLKVRSIQQADVVRPQGMKGCGGGLLQHQNQCRQRLRPRLSRLTHDAQTTVLRQRATGPAFVCIAGKPLRGKRMVHMIAVMQRNENVDVKKGTHQAQTLYAFFVTQTVDQLVADDAAACGERMDSVVRKFFRSLMPRRQGLAALRCSLC